MLNAEGDVELDAIIMDGRNLAVGAVSCIKNIANPVMFARTVMEKVQYALFLLLYMAQDDGFFITELCVM